jgi:hypothetical protein
MTDASQATTTITKLMSTDTTEQEMPHRCGAPISPAE